MATARQRAQRQLKPIGEEQLPDPLPFRRQLKPCSWCRRGDRLWQSKQWPDVIRCGHCCPPAHPGQVYQLPPLS